MLLVALVMISIDLAWSDTRTLLRDFTIDLTQSLTQDSTTWLASNMRSISITALNSTELFSTMELLPSTITPFTSRMLKAKLSLRTLRTPWDLTVQLKSRLALLLKTTFTRNPDQLVHLVVSIMLPLLKTKDPSNSVRELISSDTRELPSLSLETLFNSTTLMAHSGDNLRLKTQEEPLIQVHGSLCSRTGLFLSMLRAQPLTTTQECFTTRVALSQIWLPFLHWLPLKSYSTTLALTANYPKLSVPPLTTLNGSTDYLSMNQLLASSSHRHSLLDQQLLPLQPTALRTSSECIVQLLPVLTLLQLLQLLVPL